ncbi:MAG: 1-acyl-sn-glycerol-3-phosphate acyltransferase [Rhodospirillaceae bacterium]|jgi:1-acyl-sn-glycerol-3-phosphate acyltransferase|nr:1-acyl-sn-glycerol-3-phosphate acyltransferase [Rhodospirillaceae bacterium]
MGGLRSIVGSGLYNIVFIGWTAVSVTIMLLLLPFPRPVMQRAVKIWAWSQHWALKFLVGLDFEIRGRENIVHGAAIYASKHQSAWDTYVFYLLFSDPSYVLKKELVKIPVWGWIARKCAAIAVDRDGGASALKALVRDTRQRLADDRPVIIFPEGTRTQPGTHRPYHPGIAALYSQCDAPVIPVALNSGLFWGRRSYAKQSGTIIIEFLPPLPTDMKRRDFMQRLETQIESTAERLALEGADRYPLTRPALVQNRDTNEASPSTGPAVD